MLFMFKNKNSLFTEWPHSQGEKKTEHITSGSIISEDGWNEKQECYSCPLFLLFHLFYFILLFLSPPHSQPYLKCLSHACPLFPPSASTQSQHHSFVAVVEMGKLWRHCKSRWCKEHPLEGSPQTWMGVEWHLALSEKKSCLNQPVTHVNGFLITSALGLAGLLGFI